MNDNEKNRFDALYKLYERAWGNRSERRQYEWKGSFGVWTFLGLLTLGILNNDIEAIDRCNICWFIFFLILIAGLHIFWLLSQSPLNTLDLKIAQHLEEKMNEIADAEFPDIIKALIPQKSGEWSHIGQIGITITLCILVFTILWLGADPS